jgi:hypothetical protein
MAVVWVLRVGVLCMGFAVVEWVTAALPRSHPAFHPVAAACVHGPCCCVLTQVECMCSWPMLLCVDTG